jgi:hypothetical protein
MKGNEICSATFFVNGGHSVLLPVAQIVEVLCVLAADDAGGCYKLFPIQHEHPFTSLHVLQHDTNLNCPVYPFVLHDSHHTE